MRFKYSIVSFVEWARGVETRPIVVIPISVGEKISRQRRKLVVLFFEDKIKIIRQGPELDLKLNFEI